MLPEEVSGRGRKVTLDPTKESRHRTASSVLREKGRRAHTATLRKWRARPIAEATLAVKAPI